MLGLKMLIGALMVLIIQLFAKTRFFYLAALAPLSPNFYFSQSLYSRHAA